MQIIQIQFMVYVFESISTYIHDVFKILNYVDEGYKYNIEILIFLYRYLF